MGERSKKRKRWPWLLLGAFGAAVLWLWLRPKPELLKPVIAARFPSVRWIDTKTLAQLLTRPPEARPVLLDVRTKDEFATSQLQGARRADPQGGNLEALGIPEDATVVLYCSLGYRSAALAQKLSEAGIDEVYNLQGGIFAWANEGRPVYAEEGRAQQVHPYDHFWGRFLREELRAPLPEGTRP
jgi:rhodanese-related sulfurtransferase